MNGRTACVEEEGVASFYQCEKGLRYVPKLVCDRGSCRIYLTEGDGSAPDPLFKCLLLETHLFFSASKRAASRSSSVRGFSLVFS